MVVEPLLQTNRNNNRNTEMKGNVFCCDAFNLQHIATIDDVRQFANYLVNELNVNIHPDDDFSDYCEVGNTSCCFDEAEVADGNRLMDECFDVCEAQGADVYELMGQYLIGHIS
jgi:hypothetical protein